MEEEEQEQVYNFEGSDGQKYSAKKSELPELVEQAKAAGVVLKGVMSKEESTAARDDDYWTWDNAKAGVRGIWDDPTGEHGALAYMGLNVASGLGTAAGKVIGGMIKGAADVGFGLARGVARGVESLVGADGHAVSGFLGDWHDSFNEITDALTPDVFEKRGMYDGIEGAHETMGAINSFAESVFAMKGMGLAAKGVGALAGGRKVAAIGQAVVAAGMGGKGYAEMAEDPEGPGGWRQELAAAAKGGIEAAMFGVLGPWKKMNMAMPKPFEQLTKTEIVKRFTLEALKSGAMMGGVAAAKEGVESLATAGTDQNWHKKSAWEVSKTVMSEFLVGSAFHAVNALGKSGAWLAWRAERKNGEGALTFQVEQNRKHYAPIMDRQAQLALRAREVAARDPGAKWLEVSTPGGEGTENVKRVLPNGAVQFDDGSVWQMGKDGRARITVADGTILDARTGAVEGYRANREAAAPEEGSVSGDNIAGNQRAENAALMLDALERGELPTVAEPLEGLEITETSYKKGTVLDGEWDQAKAPPVIVWVGNDGTRVLVTGRSRAAAAAAAGVKEIKAVEVREDQGWSRQQAESLDAVENMREGRGTREEIARGVEALGIRSEEDCDRYGIVPERPVVDAITVLNEGSEALKSAATEGTVGRAWAAECAERLGKKSLGEASERAQATALDMIAGKLPPEEAGAAMDAIAELAARKPDYTDREAADAIRAARERAVGRVAVDADSEMVEMPDGTIKSVAEAKAEGAAQAQEAAAERGLNIGDEKGIYTTKVDTQNPKTPDGTNTVIFRRSPEESMRRTEEAQVIEAKDEALPQGVELGDKDTPYTPEERQRIRAFTKERAREQRGEVRNADFGRIVIGRDFVNEVTRHALSTRREVIAVSHAREIASSMTHFAASPNEEIGSKTGISRLEYGLAKLRIGEETYLVMGEVGIRNDGRPYYDQRVVAKLKADSASILRDGIETESAFDEVYDNRFRILMQASRAFALEKKRGNGSGADRGTGDRAAEPVVKKDGSVGCVRFEGAKATRTRSEDGREIVLVEGMTGEEMMRPEMREAAVQFVTRLKEMAGDVDLVFADVSAADAAEALLMAARVKAMAEESGRARSPSAPLVDAGQRLVDGLFGEKSGIRVRTGTREEAEAALRAAGETKPIKDAQGQVQGYYDRGKGEVVLFGDADAGTLAHEIGWHAVWHWAERNSPDLLLKMKRYAARTPLELKAQIKEVYGDFKGDALMDEIGAGRFERAMGERFQKLLAKSPEVRGWWRKVLHALARAWKGMARTVGGNRVDLKKIEKMDPEEAIEALTAQMLEGRRLGEGFAAGEGKRLQIVDVGGVKVPTVTDIKEAEKIHAKSPESVKGYIMQHLEDNIALMAGGTASITETTAHHYGWSPYNFATSTKGTLRKARARMATILSEILGQTKADGSTQEKKPDKNGVGWRCTMPIGVPVLDNRKNVVDMVVYDADVIVKDQGHGKFLYDITRLKKNAVLTPGLANQRNTLFGGGTQSAASGATALGNAPTAQSVSDYGSPVKGVGAQKDSQQFKRWFAGSKVVDENGEPLVVYRGSPYDPLAQEAGKGVIKPEAYFTADPEYAKRYTGNGGKVGAYYLNIRRPFDIRDPECLKHLQSIFPDHEFARGKSGALDWAEAATVDGEFLKEKFGDKYDGIIYDEGGDPGAKGVSYRGVSYVPLDGGAQVKSATDNIGTFDPGNPDIRYSRKQMNALAKSKVGEWVEGTSADGIRNAVEKRIEEGLPEGEYRFKNAEDRSRLVRGAVKFYKRFAQKTVMLSDGRCVYFVPDARARERGLTNEEAWAEYAIHAVTSSGQKLEGKEYAERLYNASKAQNIWRIENILKAERCEAIVENDPQRDSVVFFGRGIKGDVVRIVTRLDERGNVYADLSEVTMLNGGKMKKLPPRKPLTEVVETVVNRRQRGGLLTADADSISQPEGGAQGEKRPDELPPRKPLAEVVGAARYRGGLLTDDAQSISQQGGGAQGEIRPSIKKRGDEVYDDVLRAVRAGGQRVAAGRSERTEAGFDAGAALWMEREGQMGKSQDGSMTLSYSEALRLYRALAANAHMPKVLERMPHLATRDRKGRLRLNAAAFGIVDKSDLEAVKAGLKKDGMFLHEDPSWRLHNDFEEVRAMKEMSEQALAEEMEKLAEARIKGKMSGGGRTAVNILAKEIGRIACELPVTAGAPQSLKDLRKLGLGIAKELGDPKGELGKEAREAARWWREQDPVRKDPTATKSEDIAESELWAEMFGMFLADPMALQERAPNVYGKMVEAIAGNEKLAEAWNGLRRTRDAEGPHERVMRDIERQWSVNEQQAYKELLAELDKPIGKWGKRTRARLLLELHSAEGPAVMWVTDAVRERLAELKRLKKAGKIGEEEYDLLAGGAKRELEKMRVALLHKQRGGGTGRLYALDFASGVMEDVARDGVDMGDLRRYMYAKSVRDGLHQKGKAAALGMDQREAQKVLEELEGRLGADGWAKLETAAKRFQATREHHLLENEFVLEAFGRDLVNYWKMNASYVRSERTWTAEEVAAYEAARSDWMARHPGESTVIAEIEALMDMHVAKGSGTAGSSFLKPLVGSLKAVKDPIAATLENDLRIIEFAQRNHWACQLAESAKTLEMEGFAVMEDRGGGGRLRGSNRYGSVTFLKDGKRMTLVMPKVVAEGFEHDSRGVSKLVKLNRWASAILTQYSPRFALRNIWRNRASNANNIAWMGEGKLVTGMGMVGLRPVARLATFLLERAASHLPDRFARNALMNVLYGSKTNVYWEAEATRLAKMMQDPQLLRRRAEEANSLMLQGKSAEAQRLWDDIQKCQEFMRLPIFAGVRKQIMGESGKAELDELMRSLNLETNFDGTKLTGLKRAKRWMQRRAETVKRFNDFEEARVKLIALLAAQHEAELAQARGEAEPRSRDEITYQVATMSGSPRYENRGRAMNYIEFACGPFMNVGMKGAWRTVESMRYDPKSWWTKAAGRIAGRLATYVLWMGGGYKVVADWLRGDAGDDEEKNKRVDAFERFGKRMAHALANVSDYRLRNYDIVPVGLYGKWSTLAISMPRGDEDRLLMPTVDLLANGMLGSEKAQEMGFALPTDLNYGKTEAAQNTFFGSGLLPDSFRRGILWTVAQDLLGPVFGINPYNSFTQRTVYSEADFDARWEEPWNMAKKVGKQVWNDLGGQVVMPATTWDEDEGAYDDQGQWALSGAEEGEAGCMPIGGKTIFQALHSIPFLSSAASGLITFQNGGNERIARRLEKYRRDDSAPLRAAAQRVADEVIEAVRANGEDYDYGEMLEARVAELQLPEEDKEIIQGMAFSKCERILEKMGMEFDPIGEALRKMSGDEKMYRKAKRQVEAEGWEGDFD